MDKNFVTKWIPSKYVPTNIAIYLYTYTKLFELSILHSTFMYELKNYDYQI